MLKDSLFDIYFIMQNPPTIPTFPVVWLVCLLRGSRMVIDWHNYGYSILALKLTSDNLLISLSQRSVCLSVCLYVCLSVCLFYSILALKRTSDNPLVSLSQRSVGLSACLSVSVCLFYSILALKRTSDNPLVSLLQRSVCLSVCSTPSWPSN